MKLHANPTNGIPIGFSSKKQRNKFLLNTRLKQKLY